MARRGANALLALLALAVLATCVPAAHATDWQWRTGRATHYGGAGDPWSIHKGSCGYKYLDPTANKGWDVAALSDAVGEYKGSCGRCYEIACQPMHLKDGYGTGLDRSGVCHDSSASVVVMITDTCPCNYAPNAYSNRRWCCGDYFHLDVSSWAFEKLADRRWGVIGIRFREVPCSYCPDKPARVPGAPSGPAESAPSGWQPSWDKRPWGKMCFKSSLERDDGSAGGGSSQARRMSSSSSAGSSFPSDSVVTREWQDLSDRMQPWSAFTPDGWRAYCGAIEGGSSLRFKGSPGSFMGKRRLELVIKTEGGAVPDFTLQLASSSKGACRGVDLRSLRDGWRDGDWQHVTVPLTQAAWFSPDGGAAFRGCSAGIGAWDVDTIELKNKWGGRQALCLGNIKATV